MTLNTELLKLRQLKEQEKEIRRLKKENDFLKEANPHPGAVRFFSPRAVWSHQKQKNEVYCNKNQRRRIKRGYCFFLPDTPCQQAGICQYPANKDHPWKYQPLEDAMKEILEEDEYNDTYGRIRMYQALILKQPEHVEIPSERTV